jgi:glycyl-tRNA synthetase beta chain
MTTHMRELLLEIGCEELPAGFVDPALAFLASELPKLCAEHRLECADVVVDGTPRRLVLVAQVAARQRDLSEEVTGPLWSVAFADDGRLTPAGEGFFKKNGLDPAAARKVEGKKGFVVAVTRFVAGRAAADVLPGLLEGLIARVPFRKTMRWGDRHVTRGQVFGRPVQWLLCLLSGDPLRIRFADVDSGVTTRGHRYHAPEEVVVTSAASHRQALERGQVMVSRQARADAIVAEATRLASSVGGRLVNDQGLIDLVKNLVEKPWPILGRFDAAFLQVPKELLISEAREHQKYFMITDEHGSLLPCFVVVAGAKARNAEALAAGNARVLRARFEDGAFYFRTDRERSLASRVATLDTLIFHKELGHYGDKTKRIAAVGAALTEALTESLRSAGRDPSAVGVEVARAATLCKADLVTGVVNEFPELQGTMGRYYAFADGEAADVAFAIEDHYAPRHAGAPLPRSHVGAIVGIADRIDSMVGILGIGKAPSGSADPFALRRAAVAVLTIAVEFGYVFSLRAIVDAAVASYRQQGRLPAADAALAQQVVDFIAGRFKGVLVEKAAAAGFLDVADVVDAALAARGGLVNLPDVWRRVAAIATMRKQDADGFAALAATFKRVGNIVKKARDERLSFESTVPAEERLELPAERELAAAAATLVSTDSHGETLRQVAALRPAVDRFFNDVMVMVDEPGLRHARLSLLAAIEGRLVDVADFTRLQG